ncbi:MAG: hypothetical protein DRJ03_27085 [Chloroflexi bacterium]|nr:MAG: hypothetical protein DRJ03_27085 [Chloroflexota bacterium]
MSLEFSLQAKLVVRRKDGSEIDVSKENRLSDIDKALVLAWMDFDINFFLRLVREEERILLELSRLLKGY